MCAETATKSLNFVSKISLKSTFSISAHVRLVIQYNYYCKTLMLTSDPHFNESIKSKQKRKGTQKKSRRYNMRDTKWMQDDYYSLWVHVQLTKFGITVKEHWRGGLPVMTFFPINLVWQILIRNLTCFIRKWPWQEKQQEMLWEWVAMPVGQI